MLWSRCYQPDQLRKDTQEGVSEGKEWVLGNPNLFLHVTLYFQNFVLHTCVITISEAGCVTAIQRCSLAMMHGLMLSETPSADPGFPSPPESHLVQALIQALSFSPLCVSQQGPSTTLRARGVSFQAQACDPGPAKSPPLYLSPGPPVSEVTTLPHTASPAVRTNMRY